MPVDIMLGTTMSAPSTVSQYVANLRNSLETAYEYVRSQMGHKQEQQKDRYDTRSHGKAFGVGDLVWVHNPAVPRGRSKKLHRPWTGPFRVLEKISMSVYRLQCVQSSRKRVVVRFDRLKPCFSDMRQPEKREQGQHRAQSTVGLPIGTELELVDEDSEDTRLPTAGTQEAFSGPQPGPVRPLQEESSALATSTSSATTAESPCTSMSPSASPHPHPPTMRRYPQRSRAPPARLYETYS